MAILVPRLTMIAMYHKQRTYAVHAVTVSRPRASERLFLSLPSRLAALGGDLDALRGGQRRRAGNAAPPSQRDRSRIFRFRRFGFRSFPNGFQEDLMGKLDRIARAFGCHAHSMQLSAKEGQPQDFQTDPLPKMEEQSQLSTFVFRIN